MAIALIVLAIGSIFAGFVGVPHVLGGENRIERSSSRASRRSAGGAVAQSRIPRRRGTLQPGAVQPAATGAAGAPERGVHEPAASEATE